MNLSIRKPPCIRGAVEIYRYRRIFGRRPILLHLSDKVLSVPAACGRDEIYHLKYPPLSYHYYTRFIPFCKEFFYF